jgi:hypothetical protein
MGNNRGNPPIAFMSTNPSIHELLLLANRLEASDRPILDLISQHIDDLMLLEIAHCDYGDDVAIHLDALHQIRAGNIPVPLQWHPGEVLELTRWTEWDSLTPQDGAISKRNHWMRLFACTVLIWASLEPENYDCQGDYWGCIEGEESTIIQLVDSALNLGDEVSIAALTFLGWRLTSQIQRALIDEDFGECPCYAVAMLLLGSSLNRCDRETVNFLISMARCNDEYRSVFKEIDECFRSHKWRDMIQRLWLDSTALNDDRLNLDLQTLGLELMGRNQP